MFVAKDFLDAFFGRDVFINNTFMENADLSRPNITSIPQQQPTDPNIVDTLYAASLLQQQREKVIDQGTLGSGPLALRSKS